jgi:hypothetical protein
MTHIYARNVQNRYEILSIFAAKRFTGEQKDSKHNKIYSLSKHWACPFVACL